jgi:hypothetical protein
MADLKERAVRRYLVFLANPEAPVADELVSGEVAKLEKRLATTNDPIAKLRLQSNIERIQRPDRQSLEADFVANAGEWALANNIVPSAFRSMGVDPELLEKAGLADDQTDFAMQHGSGSRSKNLQRQARTGRLSNQSLKSINPRTTRRNRPPVRVDEIFPAIRKQSKRFTITQIHELAGGSIGSARTAVLSLVASGEVRAVGPKSGARGKAPMQYEVKKRAVKG